MLEATIGRGRVIMHTFRVQNRGQTWGTFKLLFNSIFYGPAMAGRPAVETSQGAMADPGPGRRRRAGVTEVLAADTQPAR